MSEATRKISLSWSREGNRSVAIAYVISQGKSAVLGINYPMTDYSLYLTDVQQLDSKTVENEITHLKAFVEYSINRSIDISAFTDDDLKGFRDEEFQRISSSVNSSGSEKAAKRTANAKLKRAYLFLLWYQEVESQAKNLIGVRGCQVTSTLGIAMRRHSRQTRYLRDSERFPLLFRQSGAAAKLGTQYVATDEDVEKLTEYFLNTMSPYAAHRNILIMQLALQASLRRASINSFLCQQFSRNVIESIEGECLAVQPPSQKFGYERRYEIPFRLAFQVLDFIESSRHQLLSSCGWLESRTQGHIFISERNGRPLRDATVSQIFGKAFRAIGRMQGRPGIHSFRRQFANDEIERETLARIEIGLDSSAISIATSVALKMGHSDPSSLTPYVSKQIGRLTGVAVPARDRIRALEEENDRLRSRVAALQKK